MKKVGKFIREYKILAVASAAYLIAGIYNFPLVIRALGNTWMYIREMLEILPAVFILTGLINVWVPPEVIMKNFGEDSGLKGKLISLLVGALSAGPIYAAFPLTRSLLIKGASIANTVVIISAWAVVKVPMFIVESKFLGLNFALTRYLLTIPGIIIIGIICERLITRSEVLEDIEGNENQEREKIIDILPGYNCGSCGFSSCSEYAAAIIAGEADNNRCLPGGKEVSEGIKQIQGG